MKWPIFSGLQSSEVCQDCCILKQFAEIFGRARNVLLKLTVYTFVPLLYILSLFLHRLVDGQDIDLNFPGFEYLVEFISS